MRTGMIEHCIATGLGFTEGPLWTRRGTLMAVGLSRGVVHELDSSDWQGRDPIATGGRPNGLAEGADADIWVAQAGQEDVPPSIQRIRDGVVTTFPGDFCAPNDLTFGPDGLLWFTDPRGHALEGQGEPGGIWAMDTRTGAFTLKAEGALYPNGLAFSPADAALYVAETATARILRYPYENGSLLAPTIFATLPAGRPDGIACDSEGNLHVAATTAGSVQIFDPTGRLMEILELPEGGFPTNLCFGGLDARTLFVTSPKGGSIYAVERPVPGLSLHGAA